MEGVRRIITNLEIDKIDFKIPKPFKQDKSGQINIKSIKWVIPKNKSLEDKFKVRISFL